MSERRATILVVDDELGDEDSIHHHAFRRSVAMLPFRFVYESCWHRTGFDVERAVNAVLESQPDLVLLDLVFGREDRRLGERILRELTATVPSVPVLVMSSAPRDIAALGTSLEDGAVGFIAKGARREAFSESITRALDMARSHVLLGQSAPLRDLRRQAARLSPYDRIPVLIVGERGTGKERVARYIHHNGPRSRGPFIAVNCAAIAESLIDAELFGAEKGAFTGASELRRGYLERADGGVLFLDEIGSMQLATQAKLLRVLQERTFRRVGVTENELTVDFQVISATNEDPETLVRAGRLREDLYDRIAAVTVRTPPLRECSSDIPELVRHFVIELGSDKVVSADAINALQRYGWPGNMRELRRVVHEAVVMSESSTAVELEHLPARISRPATAPADARRGSTDAVAVPPARQRLLDELRLAVNVKRQVQKYKGRAWRAEFMRVLYPECKAPSAKGLSDLIRRLTKGPWGASDLRSDSEAAALLNELEGDTKT
jgi:two-component system, NtrC family, nitrogen regulation response regulator NtrX